MFLNKDEDTKLAINEKEGMIVRTIFELYSEGYGYKANVNIVNNEGHKSKRGNAFSTATIKEILKNPVYIGKIRYNVRQDWNEKRRRNINPDTIIVDGENEAIIDIATWEKVQIILKDRSKTHNRVYDSELLLKKIISNINKNKSSKLKPKLDEINKVNKEIDRLNGKKNASRRRTSTF